MKEQGTLYLIPSPLGGSDPAEVIPGPVLGKLKSIRRYVVEEARTVRRYLSSAGLKGHIEELELRELNEHSTLEEVSELLNMFTDAEGNPTDVGLISEAGLPAVADPGAQLVALCHSHGIRVVPLVGPSSLMLALMASGLNGQSFAFCGYLPAKPDERRKAIREIEKRSSQLNQTEIFIETPYRNDQMLSDLLAILQPQTRLCAAADLTTEDQTIVSRSVREWRKDSGSRIGKRPCVFLILADIQSPTGR
ncbi:MAG: SAM-dependent methyltransferase [Candidatus Cryptobacteroides sp.]